jgi:hypothetical protein
MVIDWVILILLQRYAKTLKLSKNAGDISSIADISPAWV